MATAEELLDKKVADIEDKATQRAYGKLVEDYWKNELKHRTAVDVVGEMGYLQRSRFAQKYDEQREKGDWGKLSAQDTVALFVTFSPEPGTVSLDEIMRITTKMFMKPRKGIQMVLWNVEQSGDSEDTMGYHPHFHAVMILDKTNQNGERAKVRDFVTRNLKKYKTKSEAYLDIKAVSQKKLQDKCDYVTGLKRDAGKMMKVDLDILWRKKVGIERIYQFPPNSIEIDETADPLAQFTENS